MPAAAGPEAERKLSRVTEAAPQAPPTEREWWLRALLVLQSPRRVFAALRDDSDAEAAAREEPVLALVLLAGIAGVLAADVTGFLFDDPEFDAVLVAVWAFVAGAIYGVSSYFALGALVYLGARLAGGAGSYRRARHLLVFASVPLAFSLVAWPIRVAAFGGDAFRRGGSDSGDADAVFEAIELAAVAWSLGLLFLAVRVVHGWSWVRSSAATALPAAVPALVLARAYGLL